MKPLIGIFDKKKSEQEKHENAAPVENQEKCLLDSDVEILPIADPPEKKHCWKIIVVAINVLKTILFIIGIILCTWPIVHIVLNIFERRPVYYCGRTDFDDSNFLDYNEFYRRESPSEQKCSNVPKIMRFDCFPQDGATQDSCQERGCCWDPINAPKCKTGHCRERVPLNTPYCFYPEDWADYKFVNMSQDGNDFSGLLKLQAEPFYKNSISVIQMESTSLTDSILRVKVIAESSTIYFLHFQNS